MPGQVKNKSKKFRFSLVARYFFGTYLALSNQRAKKGRVVRILWTEEARKMKCPTLDELFDSLNGHLPPHVRTEVDTHLEAGCSDCQEQREMLMTALQVASEDKSFEFSQDTIARAVSYFKEQTVEETKPLGQILAKLIFDSLMPSQLAPVRTGLLESIAPAGRQVLYNAGSYDVDLRFERGEDTNDEDLIGQILPDNRLPSDIDGAAVRLLQDEIEVAHAHANKRGVFIFLRIESGIYELRIRVPDGEISINRVQTAQA